MSEEIKSLFLEYADYFPMGAAVNPGVIESHKELLVKHFNSITAENEMKFAEIHPREGEYTFEKADALVEFARTNHMKVRGHTLVWHNQTPDWVFSDASGNKVSEDVLLVRMKEHIQSVVGRYRGKVYAWDVVNEVIEDSEASFLRKSKWLECLGEDFIEKAFIFAHEADPKAILFYNDYDECSPAKSQKIYQLVKNLKDKGVPIHGIGLQAHWNIYSPSPDEIKRAIEKYASLGLQLQITELDVSLFAFTDHRTDMKSPEPELMEKQVKYYENIFRIFREYKEIITGVTFWGVADDKTWLDKFPVKNRKNWPLLFDVQHQPKEAFWKVVDFSK